MQTKLKEFLRALAFFAAVFLVALAAGGGYVAVVWLTAPYLGFSSVFLGWLWVAVVLAGLAVL